MKEDKQGELLRLSTVLSTIQREPLDKMTVLNEFLEFFMNQAGIFDW